MPSTSEKQARFMAACSHGAGYASCPPAKVSHEFNQADKGSSMLRKAVQRKAVGGPMMGAPNPLQTQLAAIRARGMPSVPNFNRGPIPPPSGAVMRPPMPAGMPPGGALNALRGPVGGMPGMGPMPMQPGGMHTMARGGMLRPPGPLGGQNYTPQPSPLAALIGNHMAAMHRGNPGIRKPRIPLPGAMRNINQTLNHAKTSLGAIGLG